VKVVWTPEAEQDRDDVWDYIAADSVTAAVRIDELFRDAAEQLADFPESGRIGKIAGTRELIPHANYRLVYEIEGGTVWLLALVHTAQLWPPSRNS
jgi:toxin ParE1/3/4